MIPDFDENGYLPPGVYLATVEEVATRFGHGSEVRRVETDSLRWLVDLARRAGVQRIIVNGSYLSDVLEPNDVDCVLLTGPDYPADLDAHMELIAGLPFIELHLVEQAEFDFFIRKVYATDRDLTPKGMIEITA